MKNTRIKLLGDGKTLIEHITSGQTLDIESVATEKHPQVFSSLDLLGTAVGLDMVCNMKDCAGKKDFITGDISAEISYNKISNPDRLAELHIELTFSDHDLNEGDKSMLESIALNGAVINSIHPNIMLNVKFRYC